jgi:hypothetical protein
MLQQPYSDAFSRKVRVGSELPKQEARDGIRRLTRSNRAGQHGGHDGTRRESVVAYDPRILMHDDDGCEASLLVRQRASLQPNVE